MTVKDVQNMSISELLTEYKQLAQRICTNYDVPVKQKEITKSHYNKLVQILYGNNQNSKK